ncbi:YpiB family protein [Thermincola potens]|uniref:IDEAL domain-containing protein n=1 Tax=Thermincola potens (strain JR) TaxID=635013 RepID=D5XE28_THEPJ|nr:YpiB family protein [Thermincola potens]ADG81899.1 Protein of unknown function UPF0302 [Thermincola potens JR]
MKRTTNLNRKRDFIRWFLGKHQLKSPEAARLLRFILENDHILKKVRFVENIRYYSDAVLISSTDSNTIPYILRLENQYYFDVEEFIHCLTASPPNRLYVWLSFNKDFICSFCPHMQEKSASGSLTRRQIRNLEREITEQILLRESAEQKLLELIDKALDKGSKEEFFRLTHQLKKIQQG